MFNDIRKNKRESWFIVFLFVIVITLIIYYICMALDLGVFSIIIAFIFSIISAWSSYYYSDKIVLKLNNARPANKEENLKLVNILDSLVVASGLSVKPQLYVVEDSQPNAFATGRDPEHAVICVTTGLLEIVTVMVGFVVMLSDMFSRMLFWGGGKSKDSDSKGNGILMLIGLVFLILSPIFGSLMQLAISRKREYLADATSVEFTRNPDGLISALIKISDDPNELKTANNSTAHMYISSPFRKKKKKSSLWSTHPNLEDRINALKSLK